MTSTEQDFDQYAVGWEAIVSNEADPADAASWAPVFSGQPDRAAAEEMTRTLREIHRHNPAVRNVKMFGRPALPDWTAIDVPDQRPAEPAPSTDLGPAIGETVAEHPTPIDDPAAAVPAPVVIEDQAVVADEAATPE
ncbi:hypothetical protein PBI_LEMURIA_26 [Mycobacterium phage Lemuria]|uniref:Uncharacterized protein n=1 Tax=Mycobacterium phage Lemuria TaxID=2599868 RepID=A0A5J6THH5_9CAUD|nr:hypothetical protein KDW76_gp26 [Mycobacterium phage Lemuria]QFG10106.1 hypothetical protein PBI_LEMURIA_26 [Mycobacterium phage Lemuria]